MNLNKNEIVATLVYPIRCNYVLLGRKTRKIGIGLWNGWGGEVEDGETVRQAAVRELGKESGLVAGTKSLDYSGRVIFHNQRPAGDPFYVDVHVFRLWEWTGELVPSDEMSDPMWWPCSCLPFSKMMPADKYWLPHVLRGKKIFAEAWYGPEQKALIRPVTVALDNASDVD